MVWSHSSSMLLCVGAEGFTSETDQDEVRKIERQLKNRFPIGSHVSEQRIVQDFLKQVSSLRSPQHKLYCYRKGVQNSGNVESKPFLCCY